MEFSRDALENGFSQYPKHEGRFLQLSGCWVTVDMSKPAGERIIEAKIGPQKDTAEEIDDEKLYVVASKTYPMVGGDGFTSLTNHTRVIVDGENGMTSANLVRKEFLVQQVTHAFQRQQRIDKIVGTAMNLFRAKPSPPPDKSHVQKEINIQVEGRINIINGSHPSK